MGSGSSESGPIFVVIDYALSMNDEEREELIALGRRLEREEQLARRNAGKERKKRLGRNVHGAVAYGFTSNEGVLRPNPTQAPVVRRIFEEARLGVSPNRIATMLNNEQIASPLGVQWTPKTIAGVLANVTYIGERYGVRRAHPAIVSRGLFEEANEAYAKRQRAWATARHRGSSA